jgi:hypothetical protein
MIEAINQYLSDEGFNTILEQSDDYKFFSNLGYNGIKVVFDHAVYAMGSYLFLRTYATVQFWGDQLDLHYFGPNGMGATRFIDLKEPDSLTRLKDCLKSWENSIKN